MINIKRIIAVGLMVLMSNIYANLVLAAVDGPDVFWKFSCLLYTSDAADD